MRIFVTGAAGFIGSEIVRQLLEAGHEVVGLVRSEENAAKLRAAGGTPYIGTLEDLDTLKKGVAQCDGVIHTAFVHDFSIYQEACKLDARVIEAIGEVLRGTERPLITTSVTAVLSSNGKLGTEISEVPQPPIPRQLGEVTTLKFASQGVRASILRLPPTVHGAGDHAFVPMLINVAKNKGVSAYIGNGMNCWPAVHRTDAANLFVLALEKGTAGSIYHAVAEEGIPIKEIAGMIGKRLDIPVISVSSEEATEHFGFLSSFLSVDNPTSSILTQQRLGWKPTHSTLMTDLASDAYF
ncbi:NAD dependent epimerase/dehydratase [Schizosaccharomyces pombe]